MNELTLKNQFFRTTFTWMFISVCLLLISGRAMGQTKKIFTLDEAIQTAVEKNAELQIAKLESEKAGAQVREAYGYAMPSLDFSSTYTRSLKSPVFLIQTPDSTGKLVLNKLKIGADNSFNLGFSVTQVLFNSAVFTGVGTAKIYQKISKEQYQSAYNKTIADVKRSFYGALLTQKILETTQASLQNAEDNLKNVKVMNQNGIVSDYDMIRAEVQVENIRPLVVEAERNATLAKNGLKLVLNLDALTLFEIAGTLEFEPIDSAITLENVVIEKNSNLRSIEFQREFNKAVATIQRSDYLPSIAAFGNYQWQAGKNSFNIQGKDFVNSSQVGLSLSINLFNGFRTTAKVAQAKKDTRKVEEQLYSAREGLRTQLQNIKYRLEESRKRIQSQGRTVELAEKGYKIAKTRYQTGSGTQLEVNDADVSLLRARLNRVQAIYDYLIAKTDLEEIVCLYKTESIN